MQQDEETPVKDADMEQEGATKTSAEQDVVEQETPDKPKEKEEDSPDDKRKRVAAKDVAVNMADATLNVLPTVGGKLLMGLTDGGFQYLLAGARTTVGVKAGRYMFEVRVIEALSPVDGGQGRQQQGQQPRQVIRAGFSTGGSSLFLGDGKDNVCFDSEGFFAHNKTWKKVMKKVGRGQTLGVLLNLDGQSPNANTMSLFCDGVRMCEPQVLPDHLIGQVLFPTVTYRNVTLQLNFAGPLAPLPFKCRMLGDAAAEDVVKSKLTPTPPGEKVEVFFPVGLPEQGFFDYVDQFMKKHPECLELSDRMLAEWAAKSGYGKPGASFGTNDRPELRSGVQVLDDLTVRKVLNAIVPTIRRSFLVAELKSNLVSKERKQALLNFSAADVKKTALVVMGEPSADYREQVQALLLAEKKAKAEEEKKKQLQQAERARAIEERRKKQAMAKKAKDLNTGEEEQQTEEKKDGESDAKEEKEEKEEEKKEVEAPVELTDEEKKIVHRKRSLPDISERILTKAFSEFSLPTTDEGFDGVTYVWQKQDECSKLMKSWIVERKLTQKAEDLEPGEWFKSEWTKWQAVYQDWRKLQHEFKDPFKRKAMLAKKKEEAKSDEKEEETPMEIDASSIEPKEVKDVTDLGNGEPLFAHFVYEDWSLLSMRYEFHLMLHAFKQDLNDPDRPSFSEPHLSFYYNKYFKKVFNFKAYGVEKFADFVELIQDTIAVDEVSSFLKPLLAADEPMTNFVKFAEEHRRERQMLVDAGDETAKLKFTRPAPPPPPRQHQEEKGGKGQQQRSGHGGGGSGYKRPYQPGPSSFGGPSKQPRQTYQGYGGNDYGRR